MLSPIHIRHQDTEYLDNNE